ncbi:MAG: SIMPL domain-containing protein [Patescibacteria group bacterium]
MSNQFSETVGSKAFFWGVLNLILLAVGIIIWKILILGLPVLPERATITVSGEGESVAIPDITRISFSVVTEGKDPATIQKENIQKMNAAIEFVKEQGVAKEDIKTANYSLYPRYDYIRQSNEYLYPGGKQVLVGYTITQTVNVKIRDAEKVSPILAAFPSKGINQIENVSFEVDEPETYLNLAREEAFEKARAKADAMASANGVRVRRVVTFSESTGGGYPIFFKEAAYGLGGATDVAPVPPQIEPGSQDISVNVSVTYEIR